MKFKSFLYTKDKLGTGIDTVSGIKDDGDSEIQAIRFNESKFTGEQARKWVDENKFSGVFEQYKGDSILNLNDSVVTEGLGDDFEHWVGSTNSIIHLCESGVIEIETDYGKFAVEMVNSRYYNNKTDGDKWLYETFDFNLAEAKFDDEAKSISLRIIQGENSKHDGISKNGNYYSGKIIEELIPHLQSRNKMYLNHQSREAAKRGEPRGLQDWAATVTEAWFSDGGAYVKADICQNQNSWIYEEIRKHPDQIGVSIDAYVKSKRGTKNAKECNIVDEWVWLSSSDFVSEASAGGVAIGIAENKIFTTAFCNLAEQATKGDNKVSDKICKLFEAHKTYKQIFDKGRATSEFYKVFYIAEDLIKYSIIDDENMSDEEKRSAMSEVLDLLKGYLMGLSLEDIKNSYESIINNRRGESSMEAKELLEVLKKATFDELKQAGNVGVLNEADKQAKKAVEGTIKSNDEAYTAALKEKDTKISKLVKDVDEGKTEIATLKEAEKVIANTAKIVTYISENKINKDLIVPSHLDVLKKMDKDELDKALEELKVFAVKAAKKSGFGKTLADLENDDKVTEEYSRDKLVNILKA